MVSIQEVRRYWESHPLLSYESEGEVGTPEYFELLATAKREDSDRFAEAYWNFGGYSGKRVLDVGCGPGYLTVEYARRGAIVSSVDLTEAAVEITRKHLAYRNCLADVRVGNAEDLPFPERSFDMVFSSGVLHHTPDTLRAFRECYRVLRPGGEAKITLYRKNLLLHPLFFNVTRAVMRLAAVKHPGADLARTSQDPDTFIRQYDGAENPVGIGKTNRDWARDLANCGFQIQGWENHFFPKRFLPAASFVPRFMHYFLDRRLGTMVYFRLLKPKGVGGGSV